MRPTRFTLMALACLISASVSAQSAPSSHSLDLRTEAWQARWISVPDTGPQDYGVYYFRKEVELSAVPATYVVHVTGDNRYKLYVNGQLVSLGPAKGDATHWNYETVDLAPQLRAGKNVIAALVFHEGPMKPDSQVSVASGFLLQGEGAAAGLYTDGSWKCIADRAYSPLPVQVVGYYVAGPGERLDMARHVRDWKAADADLSAWQDAVAGRYGEPKDFNSPDQGEGHNLRPSTLPQMELTPQRLESVRKAGGVRVPDGFLEGRNALTVPAGTRAELLLDQSVLTNAYFHLAFSGGRDARIRIGYAESLYLPVAQSEAPGSAGKGNRNETEGKVFIGRSDEIRSDGSAGQEFTTLSYRTYRYVQLLVETADEPLTIERADGVFIGYPFTLDAHLETDDQEMQQMLEIGWRTARLCAIETYMDCPYYERLQYLGDTRIQALVTLYNSADDRLVRNFLYLADISRSADGITKSRYPTTGPQHIQPYALSYIYALHDYMMYGGDVDFVMDLLPGAEQIIHYFQRYRLPDGRLKDLPGWNFSDWVYDLPSWHYGAPLEGADGCSVLMDLQLLYAYQMMADMERVRGNTWQAEQYLAEAERLTRAVKANYWNAERGLFSDRAEQDNYSQHAGALAILCGIVEDPATMGRKLLEDKSLAPCSVYYRYYLHEALVKAGLGDDYLDWLDIWRENIAMGLTTWGEKPIINSTRSDCHAWGASPSIEFYRTILGIDSAAPGFARVKIEPHLGRIREIGGTIPHPAGSVSVTYKVRGRRFEATILLPDGVKGTFHWGGEVYLLHGGKNEIHLLFR